MKKAAKVFIWFGIIFQFYLIYPIVIGAIALKKINRATDRKELQNFGVVTLFFCSFLGGLFMMLIDESSQGGGNIGTVWYEKVVLTEQEKRALNGGQTAKATRILMYCIIALSLLGMILSLACLSILSENAYYFNGVYFEYNPNPQAALMVLIPGSLQVLAIAIPAIIYFCCRQWASRHCCVSLATSIPLLAAFFATAIAAACMGERVLFIILIVVSFILLVLVIVTVSLNHKIFYKSRRKVEVSRLEIELNRLTDLQKRGVITDGEYSEMREAAIRNYKWQ